MFRAAMKGADAVAIAAEFRNAIYSLVAKPKIAAVLAQPQDFQALAQGHSLFGRHGMTI